MSAKPGVVFRRPRAPLSKQSLLTGYGKPLRCPKCTGASYYGRLKLPGEKDEPCPNCGSRLVAAHSRRV